VKHLTWIYLLLGWEEGLLKFWRVQIDRAVEH